MSGFTLVILRCHGDIEESSSAFNKRAEQSDGENIEVGEGIGEDTLNGEQPFTTTDTTRASGATRASSTTTPVTTSGTTAYGTTSTPSSVNGDGPDPTTIDGNGPASASANGYSPDPATADSDSPDLGSVGSDFIDEEGSDDSTDDSVGSEDGLKGDEEEDHGSDMHEEVRELRDEKMTYQRRKRKERVPHDTEEVPVGEARPDLDFDEIETGKISLDG
ncbi:hypothetical protein HAX54_008376, partial [Datura stramonium]|nr:hypothetical protein [Datura stramonium]